MKHLSTELKKIEQQIKTYHVMRTENLIKTKPEFSIKFDCSSAEIETPHSTDMEINEPYQTDRQEPSSKINTLNMVEPAYKRNTFNFNIGEPTFKMNAFNFNRSEPAFKMNTFNMVDSFSVVPKYPTNQRQENNDKKDESKDSSMSDDDTDTDDSLIDTSYDIDRMASDGRNILYTSYYNKKPDLIAYCLVDDDDDDDDDDDNDDDNDDKDVEDECRDWNRSRIKDIIWWDCVGKFICATEDGVYTVEYINKKFKIICVIRKKWSFIRVAANTTHLFIWVKSIENKLYGIEVYSPKFEYIRTIDFGKYRNESFVNGSVSFCVTENLIASLSIITDKQNNREVSQVAFCDMNINELHLVALGECKPNVEIRTDGRDRFFVTAGGRQFHIIVLQDGKHVINLRDIRYNGKWIAVLNNRRIAISNGRSDIELVTY